MLNSGDIVEVDLGVPQGSEPGLTRPAVTVTAQRILARSPSVVQIVPLARTIRGYTTEATPSLLTTTRASMRTLQRSVNTSGAVATSRIIGAKGNVGSVALAYIRDTLTLLMDL